MTIYRFSSDALIEEVRVVITANGGARAYIHARSDATAEQLEQVHQVFASRQWKGVPYNDHGRAALELRGFSEPEKLIAFLQQQGFTGQQPPTISKSQEDEASMGDKLRAMTLKVTGWMYNAGDVCYMRYAVGDLLHESGKGIHITDPRYAMHLEKMAGHRMNVLAGIGYAMGGIVLSAFGGKDQSKFEIRHAAEGMEDFMLREGVALPSEASLNQYTTPEKQTLLQKGKDFLTQYPSETLNTIYTGVGALLMGSSYKKLKTLTDPKDIAAEKKDIGLGIVTASSAIAGLTIKEKKPVAGKESHTLLGKAWDWIQEKPLRATGYGFMLATAAHAWASVDKYKNAMDVIKRAAEKGGVSAETLSDAHNDRKTILFRGAFVALNVVAELLMAVSSKGHGEGVKTDESTETTILATAAELIAKQNPAVQNSLIDRLSGYLSTADLLGGSAEEIAAGLRTQLAVMHQNPWVRQSKAVNLATVKEVSESPSLAPAQELPSLSIEKTGSIVRKLQPLSAEMALCV